MKEVTTPTGIADANSGMSGASQRRFLAELATSVGREALRKPRFPTVIAHMVRQFLRARDINFSKLNEIIRKHLQATPPSLPTSEELWKATSATISKGTFARMLTLLAHCGAAQSAQRRIYLRFKIEQ